MVEKAILVAVLAVAIVAAFGALAQRVECPFQRVAWELEKARGATVLVCDAEGDGGRYDCRCFR